MNTIEEQDDTVIMATAVADIVDDSISDPVDALIALGQIYGELPALHQQRRKSRPGWFRKNLLRLYRARIDWCGVGIDYVEHGGHLHVIDAWIDYAEERSSRKVDCVIGHPEDPDKYLKVTEGSGGVSLVSLIE